MQIQTNMAELVGTIGEDIQISHERQYGTFYRIVLHVQRMSETIDKIPMVVKDTILERCNVCKGSKVRVKGRVQRHCTRNEKDKRYHVQLYVQVMQMEEASETEEDKNEVVLSGTVCGNPILRRTPMGKEIADFSVIAKAGCIKSHRIWCIAWGRIAYAIEQKLDGEEIALQGRFQSRYYNKMLENGEEEQRITYEISVMKLIE